MSFYVYILYSERTDKFYTGSTQHLQNRIEEHNRGESRSTKSGIPWKEIWRQEMFTRSEAVQLENKIKKRGAKRFLEDVSRGA